MNKNNLIELQEDEKIPLKIVVEDKKSKQLLSQPLSVETTSLVNFISVFKKEQLQDEINMWVECCNFMNKTQNLEALKTLKTNSETTYFDQSVPDFLYGGRSLKKGETNYNFQIYMKKCKEYQNTIQQQEQIIQQNVAILIYQGESLKNLENTISSFTKLQIVPIIIIKSRKHFKKLFFFKYTDLYQKSYVPLYKNYSSSTNHAFLFEEKVQNNKFAFYFAFFMELDITQLIRWIYLGILRFIDPKYVVISQSNLKFECQILDLFPLISEENKIFGLQWLEKYKFEGDDLKLPSYYLQIPQSIIHSHSIFKIKQFHNPLQCIYKWSLIVDYVPEYFNLILRTQQKNIGAIGLNSILPKFMLEQPNQLELHFLNSPIFISEIIQNSENGLIDYFIEIRQKIQNQMQNHGIITTNSTIQINVILQNIVCKFQFLQGYFAISVCFFFTFYSPYQLIFYITEQSVGFTALAIIIPIFYSLNVLSFILISNLYHSKDKIIKNQQNMIFYKLNYTKQELIQGDFFNEVPNIQFSESCTFKNSFINFQVEVESDDLILDYQKNVLTNNEKNQEIILEAPLPKMLQINQIFIGLISIQKILDFTVFAFTVGNIIILYGQNLWDQSVTYQSVIFFLVISVILIEIFQKRFNLLAYTYNFSFLTYFWQIQNINNKQYLPQVQLKRKKQLAEQLLTNAVVFYCFIAVESYFDYQGYIFLGILGYLSLESIITGILQFITYLNSKQKNEFQNAQEIIQNNQIIQNKGEYPNCKLSFSLEDREKVMQIARQFVKLLKSDREQNQQKQE